MSRVRSAAWLTYVLAGLILAGLISIAVFSSKFTERVTAQTPDGDRPAIPQPAAGSVYRQTNFISDIAGLAPLLDPFMVNPWGITVRGTSPFWIANDGTS